jgi:hypothetical protein
MRITFREHAGDLPDTPTNSILPALFITVPQDMRYPFTQRFVPFSPSTRIKKHQEGCHGNVLILHHIGKTWGVPRSITKSQRISISWNQRDARFIQYTENQEPLHFSSITCSSSGGATQTAFGIVRAYNVSWLWHCNWSKSIYNVIFV